MVWAKLDDEILDNDKIVRAGVLGFALHVAAITWCARNLTDGFVPRRRALTLFDMSALKDEYVEAVGQHPQAYIDKLSDALFDLKDPTAEPVIGRLLECKLWTYDEERDGYWLKDFLIYNPSREKVLADRTRGSERKQTSRGRLASVSPETRDRLASVSHGPVPDPVPDPNKEEKSARGAPAAAQGFAEPRSETRLKSVPPPAPEPQETATVAIESRLRSHGIFAMLDAHGLSPMLSMRAFQWKKKSAWVLEAIDDCAIKSEGLGLKPEALQSKLVSFIRHAGPPKGEAKERPKLPYHALDDAPGPQMSPDMIKANQERARGLLTAIGSGVVSGSAQSEEQLRAKAQADQQRLADSERKAAAQ